MELQEKTDAFNEELKQINHPNADGPYYVRVTFSDDGKYRWYQLVVRSNLADIVCSELYRLNEMDAFLQGMMAGMIEMRLRGMRGSDG